jgi:hypothetical protein
MTAFDQPNFLVATDYGASRTDFGQSVFEKREQIRAGDRSRGNLKSV